MKKVQALVILLGVSVCFLTWEYVINKPFPFVDVLYVSDRSQFDSEETGKHSAAFSTDISILDAEKASTIRNFVDGFNREQRTGVEANMRLFVRATRFIMASSNGSDIRTLNDVLDSNSRFLKICSEYAKVVAVIAQAYGYRSRVVWMNGHTTSEVFFPDIGWVHLDAFGNIAFRSKDGEYLSLLEYRQSPDEAYPVEIDSTSYSDRQPSFFRSFQDVKNIFIDNDLYMVLSGDSIFFYPQNHRELSKVLGSVFNIEDIGYGVQFVGQEENLPKVGNVGLDFYRHFITIED